MGCEKNLSNKRAKQCLGLFAKAPHAAEVKSRLGSVYDEDFRRGLAESFLKDMILIADSLDGVDKILNFSPAASSGQMGQYLPPAWEILPQEGEGLGRRMESFFLWAFNNGYRRAVLIGSDFPTLPPQYLDQAFELLTTNWLVLGPSTDGGYYLIGLSEPHPEIFRDIEWSSGQVFAQTVDRLEADIGLLPPWYDIDYPENLTMLAGHLKGMLKEKQTNLPEHTLNFLRQHKLV